MLLKHYIRKCPCICLNGIRTWNLPSLTPNEVLILLLREVCSLSLAESPGSWTSTRGVSARGLGVTPVSWTTDSESNVPGRRPWLQNKTIIISIYFIVSYIIIFLPYYGRLYCICLFAVHYIEKSIKAEWISAMTKQFVCHVRFIYHDTFPLCGSNKTVNSDIFKKKHEDITSLSITVFINVTHGRDMRDMISLAPLLTWLLCPSLLLLTSEPPDSHSLSQLFHICNFGRY